MTALIQVAIGGVAAFDPFLPLARHRAAAYHLTDFGTGCSGNGTVIA